MSTRDYKFSPLLPFKMVPDGYSVSGTRFNNPNFDLSWFSEQNQNRPWQQKVEYAQLRQNNDRMSFQFWSSSNVDTAVLFLYDCNGSIVKSNEIFKIQDGNINFSITEQNGLDVVVYNVWTYVNNLYWVGLDEGYYYLYLQTSAEDFDDFYISEPIWVKAKHEGSILIEYSNNINKDYIIFQQTKQKFSKRIFGDVLDYQPIAERTVFLDNGYDVTQLRGDAYRGWTLYAGGNGELLPDYEIDILNYIFTLSGIKIENKAYVTADGASFKKTENINYPLYSAEIELREPIRKQSYSLRKGDLPMFYYNGTFPFVVYKVAIGENNVFDFYYGQATFIYDADSLELFVTALNDAAIAQGLDGTFYQDGNAVYYTLAIGEQYYQTDNIVLAKYFIVIHTTTAPSQNLNFYLYLQGSQTGGLSYFAEVYADNVSVVNYGSISGATINEYTHSYIENTVGTHAHYIFHDNTIYGMQMSGTYITGFNGDSPAFMTSFRLKDSPSISSFAMINVLQGSADSLEFLDVNNCISLTILRYYYRATATPKKAFSKLKFVFCRGNNLSSTELDNFYNDIWSTYALALLPFPTNGIANSGGQITSALPTSAGSGIQRSSLTNTKQWTIILT